MTDTPATPTVVTASTMTPCPRATITVLPGADNTAITVWRSDAFGQTAVRGAYLQPVAGPFVIIDYELPFGTPVTYSATGYNTAGTASAQSPSSVPVTMAWDGCPIWQDPIDATTAIIFTALVDWPQRTYDRDQEVLWPIVSDVATVLTGPRRRPTSTMTLLTSDSAQSNAMQQFCNLPAVLIRTAANWRWRGGYFAVGAEITETPHRAKSPASLDVFWQVPLIPVASPPAALLTPVHTWADVVALYATWADLVTAKATWADVVRDPNPGT